MSFKGEIQEGEIVEFPILQVLAALAIERSGSLTVRSRSFSGGKQEDEPLIELKGSATSFKGHVLAGDEEYLDWLNTALLRAGMIEPPGLRSVALQLAEYSDVILGVDTNVLYACILAEHLLDEFSRVHLRPYRESVDWVLLIIPGVVMKEVENAANQKKGGFLTHTGRRGFRALQEIMHLNRTSGFRGLSVLVAGQTNPEQARLSADGLTVLNADSMIRDQFKTFLKGVDFHKGIFFLTLDKTNASLAQAEGLNAIRVPGPRRLHRGTEVTLPPDEVVLLARVIYELAVEFGIVRVGWKDSGQEHWIELHGGWQWKSMEHWENWQLLCVAHDPSFLRAVNGYASRVDPAKVREAWKDLSDLLID